MMSIEDQIGTVFEIDIGDLCTHCGRDTSTASSIMADGEWVSCIPSGADAKLVLTSGENNIEIHVTTKGYMCPDCQRVECENCGQLTLEYEFTDEDPCILLCFNCIAKREVTNG